MRTYRHIQYEDRQRMKHLFMKGHTPEQVATELHFNVAAIYRELKRCAGAGEKHINPKSYDPKEAQADADMKRGRKNIQHKPKSKAEQAVRLLRWNVRQIRKVCDDCLEALEQEQAK